MIRHQIFTITMIVLLAIVAFASKVSVSQTPDTTTSVPRLVEEIKKLNAIDDAQKQKKGQLISGLDSSVVKLKQSAENKEEIEDIIDNTKANLRYVAVALDSKKASQAALDSAIFIMPRINIYIPPVQNIPMPDPDPEAAVKRTKKQTWFQWIFNR